jgi:hypothetical protein
MSLYQEDDHKRLTTTLLRAAAKNHERVSGALGLHHLCIGRLLKAGGPSQCHWMEILNACDDTFTEVQAAGDELADLSLLDQQRGMLIKV